MSSTNYGVFHAEDFEGTNGGERIQAAVNTAEGERGNNVVIIGPVGPDVGSRWLINKTIELPSHTTLLLQGAYLYLADEADCNLIENRDFIEGNQDIHVIGQGGARIDLNPSQQAQPDYDHRDPEIWIEQKGHKLSTITKEVIGDLSVAEFAAQRRTLPDRLLGLLFYNVENLSVRGLTLGPMPSWPLQIERVNNVRISDCTVTQDGREPSQEFIHIMGPAERVVIDNIVGSCSDDFCALDTGMPLASMRGIAEFGLARDKVTKEIRRANAGPISGVAISNVVIRNHWCTGLLRVLPARGYPIDGVHVSNIQMLETPGRSEAHAVFKFGNTHSGNLSEAYCMPEDQANITIDNVYVKDWVGPYVSVLEPVKNLTLRGLRGSHTGPFFHNYGQSIDGLTLEDCRVSLTGGPDEPFVGGMMHYCMEVWGLDDTSLTGTPAAILLNKGPLKDINIRNIFLTSALKPEDRVTGSGVAGMRLGPAAEVQSLHTSGLTIDGYETGIIVEGAKGEDVRFERVKMRNVSTPWDIRDANRVQSDISLSWR